MEKIVKKGLNLLALSLLMLGSVSPSVAVFAQEENIQEVGTENVLSPELEEANPASSSEPTSETPPLAQVPSQDQTQTLSKLETPASSTESASQAKGESDFRAKVVQGHLSMTLKNASGEEAQYTTQTRNATITVDGSGLTETLHGAVAEIRLPADYVEERSLTVAVGGVVKATGSVTRENNDFVLKVPLTDITSTTTAGFFFNFKFKDRLTPSGYTLNPRVVIRQEDNSMITAVDSSLSYSVKTDTPKFKKYIKNNTDNTFTNDHQNVYAGKSIPFFFGLSTQYTEGGNTQNWGNGLAQTRMLKTIKITDTLPTYTKKDNSKATAIFDANKNSGWTDNGDGTVSYTVEASAMTTEEEAARQLPKVKLLLDFPEAKDQVTVVNTAKLELLPFNQGANEAVQEVTDSITYKLTNQIVPAGALSKNNNNGQAMNLEPGTNHLVTTNWVLTIQNTSVFPMKDLVVTDKQFDQRLYIKSARLATNPNNHKIHVYALKADGSKVDLGVLTKPNEIINDIDKTALAAIQDQVQKVAEGSLAEKDAPEVARDYVGLTYELENGETLKPSEKVVVWLETALRKPYDIEHILAKTRFENTATMKGKVIDSDESDKEESFTAQGGSAVIAKMLPETVQMTNKTEGNAKGSVGENITYTSNLYLNISRGRALHNQKVVHILPQGVKVNSLAVDTVNQHYIAKQEIIENYNGTGRTAAIFYLKDLAPGDTRPSFRYMVRAKITDEAIPTVIQKEGNPEIDGQDYAYYIADELPDLLATVSNKSPLDNVYKIEDSKGSVPTSLVGAKTKTLVNVPFKLSSEKKIGLSDDLATFTKGTLLTDYDQAFYYNLETKNYTPAEVDTFTLYDKLPAANDRKGSKFANHLTGKIAADSRFTVYYHTSSDLSDNPAEAVKASGWTTAPSDYSQVTAIKISLNSGASIHPAEILRFIVPMKTPVYRDSSTNGQPAINRYYTNRDKANPDDFGETNTVTNQLPQYIPVQKTWLGERNLDQVTFELYRESDPETVINSWILNSANNWSAIFKSDKNGQLLLPNILDFHVREKLSDQYQKDYDTRTSGAASAAQGIVITNSRKTVKLTVVKTWQGDEASQRPSSITVQLTKDGQALEGKTLELSAANNWTGDFTDLPRSDNGVEHKYDVVEVSHFAAYLVEQEVSTKDSEGNFHVQIINKLVQPSASPAISQDVQGQVQKGKVSFSAGKTTIRGKEVEVPLKENSLKFIVEGQKETASEIETKDKNNRVIGRYSLAQDGTVTFIPNKDFVGTPQQATVQAEDENGVKVSTTYTPTVISVTPTAMDVTSTDIQGATQIGKPVFSPGDEKVPMDDTVPAKLKDENGNLVTELTIARQGTYTVAADGTVTFVPEKSFVGAATSVTVIRQDVNGTKTEGHYMPTVTAVSPIGHNVETSGLQGAEQVGTPMFVPGDSRVPIWIDQSQPAQFVVDGQISKETNLPAISEGQEIGRYTINPETGQIIFIPNKDFIGTADPVTIQVRDVNGTAAQATYIPTVRPTSRNGLDKTTTDIQGKSQSATPEYTYNSDPSDASRLEKIVISKQNPARFLVNGQASDETSLPATSKGQEIGRYTLNPETGQVTFTPHKDFTGTVDAVTVQVKDPNGVAVTATYTPTVTPVVPNGRSEGSTGKQGQPQSRKIEFSSGHKDVPMDDNVPATFADGTTERVIKGKGTYTVAADGTVTFVPEKSFVGVATSVTVIRQDVNGTKAEGHYTPTVTAVTPSASDVTSTDIQGATQTGKPVFVPGDEKVPMDDTVPATFDDGTTERVIKGKGTYTVAADGTVTFVPEKSFVGAATSVTVIRQDVNGTKAEGHYMPTVTAVSPTAIAAETSDIQGQVQKGQVHFKPGTAVINKEEKTVPLKTNSLKFIVEGQKETASEIETKDKNNRVIGRYSLAQDGTVTFIPNKDFVGTPQQATVQAEDENGVKVSTTYTPTVISVTPTAMDVTSTDIQGATQIGKPVFSPGDEKVPMDDTVPAKLKDENGNLVTELTIARQGTYTVAADGTVTFVPEKSFVGAATSVTVVRQDVNGTKTEGHYTPTVTAVIITGSQEKSSDVQGKTQSELPTFTDQDGNPVKPSKDNPARLVDPKTGQVTDQTSVLALKDGKEVGTYTIDPETGRVTFTPHKDFVGSPDPAQIALADRFGNEGRATYAPTVTPSLAETPRDAKPQGDKHSLAEQTNVKTTNSRRLPLTGTARANLLVILGISLLCATALFAKWQKR